MSQVYKVVTYFRDAGHSFYPGETFPAVRLAGLGCDVSKQEASGHLEATGTILDEVMEPGLPPVEFMVALSEPEQPSA